MPQAIPPDDFDVHKDVLEYVKAMDAEREGQPIPKDLFGVVSLLPRRLMGAALLFSLMALSAVISWAWAIRTARTDEDSAANKYVLMQALPRINERLNAVEMEQANSRGDAQRRDREFADLAKTVNEMAKAQARMEGKLDKALR